MPDGKLPTPQQILGSINRLRLKTNSSQSQAVNVKRPKRANLSFDRAGEREFTRDEMTNAVSQWKRSRAGS